MSNLNPSDVDKLYELMKECSLCPQDCGINRFKGDTGVCKQTDRIKIASAFPHFGEELPLVGHNGSGTIFVSGCNLKCIYCQNYEISHFNEGEEISVNELALTMIDLQIRGVSNINFVTPTHQSAVIADAIYLAKERGFMLPIVYNCGGFESVEVLKLLEGFVDIYMPDIKYFNDESAKKYSKAKNYTQIVKDAVKEMHRQVGDLQIDARGLAKKGLLIRHLVLPNNVSNSKAIMNYIVEEISPYSYINIMDQYYPAFKAYDCVELKRKIQSKEFTEVVDYAISLGLEPADRF